MAARNRKRKRERRQVQQMYMSFSCSKDSPLAIAKNKKPDRMINEEVCRSSVVAAKNRARLLGLVETFELIYKTPQARKGTGKPSIPNRRQVFRESVVKLLMQLSDPYKRDLLCPVLLEQIEKLERKARELRLL